MPAPDVEPREVRRELARRFLHVSGPGTAAGFGDWAGIKPKRAAAIVADLADELTAVRSPIGNAWILTADEPSFTDRAGASPDPTAVRLLPSGDAYTLHQGVERELLVPDAERRALLWTSRVWPGAVLVGGEIVGTWRRADRTFTIQTWGSLAAAPRLDRERPRPRDATPPTSPPTSTAPGQTRDVQSGARRSASGTRSSRSRPWWRV